jgi:membrane protein implicated in regulation of membrane protease activity
MNQPKQTLSGTVLAATLHVFVVPMLFWSIAIGLLIAPGVFAAPFGIVFVWLVVRWSNRRDDPRHAKRPPDAP